MKDYELKRNFYKKGTKIYFANNPYEAEYNIVSDTIKNYTQEGYRVETTKGYDIGISDIYTDYKELANNLIISLDKFVLQLQEQRCVLVEWLHGEI